jgi:hypothetical protein
VLGADAGQEEVGLPREPPSRCDGLAKNRGNFLVGKLFAGRIEQHGPDGSAGNPSENKIRTERLAADPETIPGSPIADQSRSPASVPGSAAGAKMAMVRAVPYEAFQGPGARAARAPHADVR